MGRGRTGIGVERRENSIRIHFTWNGERCRETLQIPPTPPNVKYAERMVAEIKRKIDQSTFRYSDYFPNSARARAAPVSQRKTVREYGPLWLASRSDLDTKTRYDYGQALKFWYRQETLDGNVLFGDRPAG
jgi:integrase